MIETIIQRCKYTHFQLNIPNKRASELKKKNDWSNIQSRLSNNKVQTDSFHRRIELSSSTLLLTTSTTTRAYLLVVSTCATSRSTCQHHDNNLYNLYILYLRNSFNVAMLHLLLWHRVYKKELGYHY